MSVERSVGAPWVAWLAVAAMLIGVAAMVTAVAVVIQTRRQGEFSRFNAGLASIWQLRAEWTGEEMLDVRAAAAEALIEGQGGDDVDTVLDFFDEVAFLMRRGAVDEELVWYQFYWPMVHYWAAAQGYVSAVRATEPAAWEQLEAAMPALLANEARRAGRPAETSLPDRAEIREFLDSEAGGGPCADDDARPTPLRLEQRQREDPWCVRMPSAASGRVAA